VLGQEMRTDAAGTVLKLIRARGLGPQSPAQIRMSSSSKV